MKIALICLILSLSACGTTAVSTKLPLPGQPTYPVFTEKEYRATKCLPESVKKKLILRDKLKTEHINELENIIKATH